VARENAFIPAEKVAGYVETRFSSVSDSAGRSTKPRLRSQPYRNSPDRARQRLADVPHHVPNAMR